MTCCPNELEVAALLRSSTKLTSRVLCCRGSSKRMNPGWFVFPERPISSIPVRYAQIVRIKSLAEILFCNWVVIGDVSPAAVTVDVLLLTSVWMSNPSCSGRYVSYETFTCVGEKLLKPYLVSCSRISPVHARIFPWSCSVVSSRGSPSSSPWHRSHCEESSAKDPTALVNCANAVHLA